MPRCKFHNGVSVAKELSVMGLLRRWASTHAGLRRNCLLQVYKSFIRSVLEFRCAVFSGLPRYYLARLGVLRRRALRLFLGLQRYVAYNVLYCETRDIGQFR